MGQVDNSDSVASVCQLPQLAKTQTSLGAVSLQVMVIVRTSELAKHKTQ